MKLLIFIACTCISLSSNALELYSCTDKSGKTHYTNLPKNSLDSNCKSKNLHSVLLKQDYDNLKNIYSKYESLENESDDFSKQVLDLNSLENPPDTLKQKVSDIFDSEKAFDELMEATENRDDVFTRAIRGRTTQMKETIDKTHQINNVIDKLETNTLQ